MGKIEKKFEVAHKACGRSCFFHYQTSKVTTTTKEKKLILEFAAQKHRLHGCKVQGEKYWIKDEKTIEGPAKLDSKK